VTVVSDIGRYGGYSGDCGSESDKRQAWGGGCWS